MAFFSKAEKLAFFLVLERDLGVDHNEVLQVTKTLASVQVIIFKHSLECSKINVKYGHLSYYISIKHGHYVLGQVRKEIYLITCSSCIVELYITLGKF